MRYETGIEYAACNNNAYTCFQDAKNAGYAVGAEPRESAIVVFNRRPGTSLDVGHVGIVTGVGENSITIRDANWGKALTVDEHTESTTNYEILGYIYCDGNANTTETRDTTAVIQGYFVWERGKTDDCESGLAFYRFYDDIGFPLPKSEACSDVRQMLTAPPSRESVEESTEPLWKRFWQSAYQLISNTKHDLFGAAVAQAAESHFSYGTIRVENQTSKATIVSELSSNPNVSHPPSQLYAANPGNPQPLPNLRVWSVGLFSGEQELNEGSSLLVTGAEYVIRVYPISEDEDATNGVDSDTQNIETDVFYAVALDMPTNWKHLGRVYTRPSTLTNGDPHKESLSISIPSAAAGNRLYLKAKVDSTGEVKETNEGDNWSDENKEWYPISGACNLTISSIGLDNAKTGLYVGERYGLRAAVRNVGTTPCPGETRMTYYEKRPGMANFVAVADDGSDAKELLPGVDQWEHTLSEPFTASVPGNYEIMACADTNNADPETNESDNCKTNSFAVAAPDLYVADMYIKVGSGVYRAGSTIKKGSYVHPYCVVGNKGTSSIHPGFRLAYYINTGTYRDSDGLDPNQVCVGCLKTEYVSSDSIKLGDTGERSYRCRVDYQGAVPELDEGNNEAVFKFYVR